MKWGEKMKNFLLLASCFLGAYYFYKHEKIYISYILSEIFEEHKGYDSDIELRKMLYSI